MLQSGGYPKAAQLVAILALSQARARCTATGPRTDGAGVFSRFLFTLLDQEGRSPHTLLSISLTLIDAITATDGLDEQFQPQSYIPREMEMMTASSFIGDASKPLLPCRPVGFGGIVIPFPDELHGPRASDKASAEPAFDEARAVSEEVPAVAGAVPVVADGALEAKQRLVTIDDITRLTEKLIGGDAKADADPLHFIIPYETQLKALDAAWSTFESVAKAFFDGAIAQDLCVALDKAWQARPGIKEPAFVEVVKGAVTAIAPPVV
jgi:hypothetical protein